MSSDGASKIVVQEEEPAVRGIPSAPTSIAGAVGITERGPIDTPVLCSSYEEYVQSFGKFTLNSDLALATMGFFENGGTQLWVVRTVHHSDIATPGSATATKASALLVGDTLRIEGKDPGAYANHVDVEVRAASTGAQDAFDLLVIDDGVHRELFSNLRMDPKDSRYVERIVNSSTIGSWRIRVVDQHATGNPVPAVQKVTLSGGNDGLVGLDDNDFIGSEAGKTGLRALDRIQDFSLLLVPGRATPAVHNAMLRYCEVDRGGMAFAILDPPAGAGATDVVAYVESTAALLNLSEYGAIYWPRLRVLNPSKSVFGFDANVVVPPSGVIAGVYARTDAARSGGIYDPPAGIDKGKMFGVVGFETDETLEERKRDIVYPKRINSLTTGPGMPRYIDGSRTLKGDGNFPYVAERRGVIFIEKSLKAGLEFARHKNNTENLRSAVRRTISTFLLTQMNNGAFRSRDARQAFFVDVSDKLNPPSVVFAGRLVARVGLATNKPAEFIVLSLSAFTKAVDEELAQAGA